MNKMIAFGAVAALTVSLSACGSGRNGYSERDLCNDGRKHFNSAPAIGGDRIETASFVVPVKGGGFSGGGGSRGGGFSGGGSRSGFSSGGSKSGSSGGSKSWGWGNKSNSNSGTKSGGLTSVKGFSGSKPSWTNKTGSVVKDAKGKLFFKSKPKYYSHGTSYRNGHAFPYFIYIGDDGQQYPVYCDN